MASIWIKDEEQERRKNFLMLLMVVFTLLVGSSGMKGNPLYYLSFLAASLTYYILLERQRIGSAILIAISGMTGLTFTAYIATVYSTESLVAFIDLGPALYLLIFGLIVVGMLPDNVVSNWRQRLAAR
ncbi:MAG: hypothetical protein ABEK01_02850 [Candidatus Nanohaloarchaea archaeon]